MMRSLGGQAGDRVSGESRRPLDYAEAQVAVTASSDLATWRRRL
jgi:hypothetical protein